MEYKDFSRCVICRSKKNMEDYHGEFEVTMLLNTLYMTVMYPMEKRGEIHVKSKTIVPYLTEHGLVDYCGNQFQKDDVLRYLRNSLAHFNVKVASDPYGKRIESIKLWGINSTEEVTEKYKENKAGAICEFRFTVEQLRDFTYFIIESVLNGLPDGICHDCKYRGKAT